MSILKLTLELQQKWNWNPINWNYYQLLLLLLLQIIKEYSEKLLIFCYGSDIVIGIVQNGRSLSGNAFLS